jgi:hypothetical protein
MGAKEVLLYSSIVGVNTNSCGQVTSLEVKSDNRRATVQVSDVIIHPSPFE